MTQIGFQGWYLIGEQVAFPLTSYLRDGEQIAIQVWAQAMVQVRDYVRTQAWNQVGEQVWHQVREQVLFKEEAPT